MFVFLIFSLILRTLLDLLNYTFLSPADRYNAYATYMRVYYCRTDSFLFVFIIIIIGLSCNFEQINKTRIIIAYKASTLRSYVVRVRQSCRSSWLEKIYSIIIDYAHAAQNTLTTRPSSVWGVLPDNGTTACFSFAVAAYS